ncbi:MAG: exodeoxyribonuclease VII small subunit [Synechococcaceae cyanobacterium]
MSPWVLNPLFEAVRLPPQHTNTAPTLCLRNHSGDDWVTNPPPHPFLRRTRPAMPASPRSRSGAPLDASRSEVGAAGPAPDTADAAPDTAKAARNRGEPAGGMPEPAKPEWREGVDDLSFREAQLALELVLSQLQASDLDVEAMVELHRRGQAYAERCETLLQQVDQEVRLWDPDDPDAAARPYLPGQSQAPSPGV